MIHVNFTVRLDRWAVWSLGPDQVVVEDDVFGRGRDVVAVASQYFKPDCSGRVVEKLLVRDLAHYNWGLSWCWWPEDVVNDERALKAGGGQDVFDVPVSASS